MNRSVAEVWDVWFEVALEEDGSWVFLEIDGPKSREKLRTTSRARMDDQGRELHITLEVLDPPTIVEREERADGGIVSRPPFGVKSVRNLFSKLVLYGVLFDELEGRTFDLIRYIDAETGDVVREQKNSKIRSLR